MKSNLNGKNSFDKNNGQIAKNTFRMQVSLIVDQNDKQKKRIGEIEKKMKQELGPPKVDEEASSIRFVGM